MKAFHFVSHAKSRPSLQQGIEDGFFKTSKKGEIGLIKGLSLLLGRDVGQFQWTHDMDSPDSKIYVVPFLMRNGGASCYKFT